MKKILGAVLACTMTLTGMGVFAEDNIAYGFEAADEFAASAQSGSLKIIIDGAELISERKPVLIEDYTYFPLRAICETLGARVDWNAETGTVTLTRQVELVTSFSAADGAMDYAQEERVAEIDTVNKSALIDGNTFDFYVRIIDDRSYAPVRALCGLLLADVDWNEETSSVMIFK